MRINTNVASLQAQESNAITNKNVNSSLEKLSTGLRINKASDDAAGLSIADKLRTQANGLNQAVSNGNSAVTLTQIADKAMAEQSNILDVIKQKLIQAGTATTSAEGIEAIGKDISKLMDQIDNISKQTTYNGTDLLKTTSQSASAISATAVKATGVASGVNALRSLSGGSSIAVVSAAQVLVNTQVSALNTADLVSSKEGTALTFQMGTREEDTIVTQKGVQATVAGLDGMAEAKKTVLKFNELGDAATMQSAARGLLDNVDDALSELNGWRADFGSTQNQLESSIRNIMTQVTNTKAAESVIRDVDYAQESASFNKQNIISQAGTYALSQANSTSQNVMRLLQ